MVVEELLELLVDKVDRNLLKAIVLKNLETYTLSILVMVGSGCFRSICTCNIQDSAEVGFLQSCINKSVVTLDDEPIILLPLYMDSFIVLLYIPLE